MFWRLNDCARMLLASFLMAFAGGCGAHTVSNHQLAAELAAVNSAAERADLKTVKDNRKIIYSGELRLAVKSLDETEREVKQLLAAAEGQIAEFREERTAGDRRAGRWKVRVSPSKFNDFVEQVAALGVPELREVQTSDVTEEYIDIEARLKNKRQLETRILKLLEEKTGEIKDVVTVENELARIREEIERIEGRLRYLTNQVDLSTVSIFAFERVEYTPPTAPTFGERIATTFSTSLHSMQQLGESLVIAIVALAPWLVLFALLGGISWLVLLRIVRLLSRTAR